MPAIKKGNLFAFFIILLIPLVFYLFFELRKHKTGLRLKKLPVLSQEAIPDFYFISHQGTAVTKKQIQDKILIADFFYTTCPGICKAMSREMVRVQKYIAGHPNLKSKYQLLSHTVDPATDSVETLRLYAELYGVDPDLWLLVTGNKDEIYDLAINFYKLPASEIMRDTLEPFVHSERFVLVDKEGFIRGYYDGTDSSSVKELMKDIVYLDIDYEMRKSKKKKQD